MTEKEINQREYVFQKYAQLYFQYRVTKICSTGILKQNKNETTRKGFFFQ